MTASIEIQRAVRGFQARLAYNEYKSARMIQTRWRGHVARVNFQISVVSVKNIQSFTRCQINYRRYVKFRRGIILLQSVHRGSEERKDIQRKNVAAVVLQSWLRAVLEASFFNAHRAAAVILQRTVRGMITRSEIELQQFAASEIQLCWMHYQSQRIASATDIQRVARGMIARSDMELQFFAASEIQRVWRGHRVSADFNTKVSAAIIIESFIRQINARNVSSRNKLDQLHREDAALKIQTFYKSFRFQQKLKHKLVVAQRVVRGFLGRRRRDRLIQTIVMLQSRYRGKKTRKSMSKRARAASLRIERANKVAAEKPQMKLGMRTKSALEILLKSKRLAE
eukprot:6952474-Ditylum_brightwellii.AAC.1